MSVNLTLKQLEQVKIIKEHTGKSQNGILAESIMYGLKKFQKSDNQLFWVKARINPLRMKEMGQKLSSDELKTSMIKLTYCLKNDPTVGISLWEAKNQEEFNFLFEPHKEFYKEVIDVNPAIKPEEAMNLILQEII